MKNLVIAPLALLVLALSLSGCFFPGRYHDRAGGGYGGYSHQAGPPRPYSGYHQGP